MDKGKDRKTIHSEARNIIRNVVIFFDEQKVNGEWKYPLEKATELAVAATGKSESVIKAIRKEIKNTDGLLRSPTKKRKSGGSNKIILDNFEQGILRRTVHELYTVEKRVPTLNILKEKMKEKVDFNGGRDTLKKYLLALGFSYKKCHDKRKLLMERSDIVAWRSRFLRTMRENENAGENKKPVTYLDETYIHPSYGVSKCWQSDEEPGVYHSERYGQRYIIVHAGGSYGFVENGLLIFKSKTKSGDYHDDMNHANFMKWLENQLIPNLPPNGMVVMDNAPYHSVQISKRPTTNNKKEEIRIWLAEHGIPTPVDMRKDELIMKVREVYTPKTYYVDDLLEKHGHTVVRLPPYHCELNPIELIWSMMKRKVAMHNVAQAGKDIENLVRTAFSEITAEDWRKECVHVNKVGEEMWLRDGLMDDVTDGFTFTVNTVYIILYVPTTHLSTLSISTASATIVIICTITGTMYLNITKYLTKDSFLD